MKAQPMKECSSCGAEYSARFPTHCMANFTAKARQTELLGRYVERAEKAEAKVRELMAWIDGYPCKCPRPGSTSATGVPGPGSDT
jgi:hypothetical protein